MCNTYPFVPTFLKNFQAIDTFIRDFGKDLLNVDVCLCKNGFPDEDTQSEMCNFSDKMGNEIFTLCRDFFNVLKRVALMCKTRRFLKRSSEILTNMAKSSCSLQAITLLMMTCLENRLNTTDTTLIPLIWTTKN